MDSREYAFEGTRPRIHETARVSREATLVGDVTVGPEASVWPGTVLRGDVGTVAVGGNSHVGDNAVCHVSTVGERVMVGHGVVCNEATVEDGCLVGENSVVASGTVIPEDYDVPPESFVRGVPARVTPLSETTIDPTEVSEAYSSGAYTDLVARHEELFR
jgi:carbonic anhydrase/acetyltransferase-like protein (isoleucine patch superfamily)